jgi:hypothetical protein
MPVKVTSIDMKTTAIPTFILNNNGESHLKILFSSFRATMTDNPLGANLSV